MVDYKYAHGRIAESIKFITQEMAEFKKEYDFKDYKFGYLRTKDDAEIDLIIERPGLPMVLVEIKSTDKIDDRSTKTVETFLKDFKGAEGFCLSRDTISKRIGKINCLHWKEGLKDILCLIPT